MEKTKQTKLYEMLENMSNYSSEQPKAIEDLCNDLYISPAYGPVMDLLVEAFLTVYSFTLLMSQGLVSNASAILRILIEQVAALTVISKNDKAMSEFLRFQTRKKQYYGSIGEEHEKIRDHLFQESGYKHKKESALKDYLDYGWIRAINNNKSERGEKLIIKEAHLEEFNVDIEEQLNAFAHGQRSIFSFMKNKDLADRHVSRIIMAAGKLFLFLCSAKHELLENECMSDNRQFKSYLNAKILFLDLNARAINERIVDIIRTSSNIDRDILLSMSMIDHMRGLIYQPELNNGQVNFLARAYVIDLINFMFKISYKFFSNGDSFFDGIKKFDDLVFKIGLDKIEFYYKSEEHFVPLTQLIEMINRNDDDWRLIKGNGQVAKIDEIFMTEFTSLVHSLFEAAYPNTDQNELLKAFVTID